MAKNLLEGLEVNELALEYNLLSLEGIAEGDAVTPVIEGLKCSAANDSEKTGKQAGRLKDQYPFFEVGYVKSKGDITVYPIFNPSHELDAKIKGYKHVFGGNCALVLCEANGKEFMLFEPDSKAKDYSKMLDSIQRIKLACIATGDVKVPDEAPAQIFEGDFAEFLNKGFVKEDWFPLLLYRTIFEVKNYEKSQEGYVQARVKSPLDNSKDLELIASTFFLENNKPKEISSSFYFIGSI